MSMKGKICLVTGGSKGIGRMIASGFVSNGAKVYICSRKGKLCEEVSAELNQKYGEIAGGSAHSLPGDLSSIEGVVKVVEDLKQKEDKLHVLVNNAGATWGGTLEEFPDAAWEKVMNLNVRHVFNLTQKCIPLLAKAAVLGDPARVVNISSADGVRATQSFGPNAAFSYTTSKGAVIHLSKTLTRALAEYNISVNVIAPGVFPSQMTKYLIADDSGKEMMSSSNPLKRVGRTADMAATALYLCSKGGAWTNGAVITVDGGAHLF
mmetsp:Transcript_2166/g.2488  ORF Transcript_2166/g.2488 Transcript_2166/m.2488 type:complete len:264 (+) Transcript_2166:29-820(+)